MDLLVQHAQRKGDVCRRRHQEQKHEEDRRAEARQVCRAARPAPRKYVTAAVTACPEGLTSQLKPARKTWVQPETIANVPVRITYTGHDLVRGRPPIYHKHGLQVAQGPTIMMANEPITIQVMHLGVTPLRQITDMTIGYIDAHEGPSYEVSKRKLKELATPPKGVEDSPLPKVDVSSVPTEWSGAVQALLQKHSALWERKLG